MKASVAKISLVVALVLFLTGFLVLCYCPGWYALAAGFAGVSAWLGSGRTRAWGVLGGVASLALTVFHIYGKMHEAERVREKMRRYEEKQMHRTNQITRPGAAPAP